MYLATQASQPRQNLFGPRYLLGSQPQVLLLNDVNNSFTLLHVHLMVGTVNSLAAIIPKAVFLSYFICTKA
jgi:hypothetical protein